MTQILNLRKSGTVQKTRPQGLKTFSFVSCHMKNNIEVIQFHIKSWGVQGLVTVQVTFAKCTTSFNFENDEAGIKTTIADLQPTAY